MSTLLIADGAHALAADTDQQVRASCWIQRFYPDVTCEETVAGFVLHASERSQRELQDLWDVALLTERLLDNAAGFRFIALARLGQC